MAEYINVPCIDGTHKEIVYNIRDFPLKKFDAVEYVTKRGKKPCKYLNIACAFDIETTNIKKLDLKNVSRETFYGESFMYHWQFCIYDTVVFGRTWEEFLFLMEGIRKFFKLDSSRKMVIYVHNLSYEFQFIKDFMRFNNVFAKEAHKVMKCSNNYFEFRCSYYLSNMSLGKFCENTPNVVHYKLTDTFDYSIIRTSTTKLSEDEKAYCYNDVRGLCECITEYLKHDTIATIPLTSTGFVRREYRSVMQSQNNRTIFQNCTLNSDQYEMLRKAFRGADTHANRKHSGKVIMNVYTADFSSDYPAQILMSYFPMGKFSDIEINTKEELDYYTRKFCVIMQVVFKNIELKENVPSPYIDLGHCENYNDIRLDNGRILKAKFIRLTITEIDLKIIQKTYKFDYIVVEKAMYTVRGKLPKELRLKCLEFFKLKSQLKGIAGKEYEYMKSKNRLNSTYGMMVTDIVKDEIEFSDNEWKKVHVDIETSLNHYYKSRNNFLAYQWGVYVTAHARRLLNCLQTILKNDSIYWDTDSDYFINRNNLRKLKNFNRLLQLRAENNDIPAFVDVNGKRFYLGTLDIEDEPYIFFKTLGAKKYCYNDNEGNFHTTVSGMQKKKGAERVMCVGNFKIGAEFHDIGRTTAWYNDRQIRKIRVNGERFLSASNVGILGNTYTLGVTNEYWELLVENGVLPIDVLAEIV